MIIAMIALQTLQTLQLDQALFKLVKNHLIASGYVCPLRELEERDLRPTI